MDVARPDVVEPPPGAPFDDDCRACVGLCCVGLAFQRSGDFPFDKPSGTPCRNLAADHSCRVHEDLIAGGYRGCVAYSCFGAGPAVTRGLAPVTWHDSPASAGRMFRAFGEVRVLQELRWHLHAALAESLDPPLRAAVATVDRDATALAGRLAVNVDTPAQADTPTLVASVREAGAAVLREASAFVRGPVVGRDLAGADLVGADLRGSDLRRASLRGALLLGADLRGVHLDRADLTGADLRGARLDRADLRTALFVTDMQLRSARGSAATLLPPSSTRPAHWDG